MAPRTDRPAKMKNVLLGPIESLDIKMGQMIDMMKTVPKRARTQTPRPVSIVVSAA